MKKTDQLPQEIRTVLAQELDPAFAKRAEFIFDEIQKNKPSRVLDIGCGRGFYVKCLTFFPFIKEIIGIDLKEEYLEKAQKLIGKNSRVKLIQGSIYKLPFKNNYFDCVIASEILEHLPDDTTAVQELYRVLKPHGKLLVSVPHSNFPFFWDPINFILMKVFNTHIHKDIWWLAGIWADHERLYSEKQIKNLLTKSKFHVGNFQRIVKYCWPFTHFFLYAIGKNLVELAGAKNVSRFNFTERPFAQLLAKFIALPQRLERSINPKDRFMNMVVAGEKVSDKK